MAEQKPTTTSNSPTVYGPPKSIAREYLEQGLITVIMALFLMTFIAQAVAVPTGSMQNTINIGDHLFVNKFVFGRRSSASFCQHARFARETSSSSSCQVIRRSIMSSE
jgi:hypothetical protein